MCYSEYKMDKRYYESLDEERHKEWRTEFNRDRARIIHGAAFRRLQGKTQVMGAGEGDFHRTRLTHSMEVAQIALGIFQGLKYGELGKVCKDLEGCLINARPVISSACYAHDLGHPPFGHGGERALHAQMKECGGFEGNAQTVRILTRLEKYHEDKGINPTRRILLSVLKYPVSYSEYPTEFQQKDKPPKCYFDSEKDIVDWALNAFTKEDKKRFIELTGNKPKHMTLDASMMECGDDIAYCTHDLEDIIARKLISKEDLLKSLDNNLNEDDMVCDNFKFTTNDFEDMFENAYKRKQKIGKLVHMLIATCVLNYDKDFSHPLLAHRISTNPKLKKFITFLKKDLTYGMVVAKPEVQMLERKGQRLITKLFQEYCSAPDQLIPHWDEFETHETTRRRICDYIAGMTDSFAEKMYHRMFTPGFGSSRDEL